MPDLTPYLEALTTDERAAFLARIGTPQQFTARMDAMKAQAHDNWSRYAQTARTERQRATGRRMVAIIEAQA